MYPQEKILGGKLFSAKMQISSFDGHHHRDFLAWVLQTTFFKNFRKFSVRYHWYSFYTGGCKFTKEELFRVVHRTNFSSKHNFSCVTDNVYIWMPILMPMPMPGRRWRDFQMAFHQFLVDNLLCRTFKWLLLNYFRD